MMRIRCDNCEAEWTTKGGGHRRFYQWFKPGTRDPDYAFNMIPVGARLRIPLADTYEGEDPRTMEIVFGPYEFKRANTLEMWESVLETIAAIGPKRFLQLACPHYNTTVLDDDNDPSRGV